MKNSFFCHLLHVFYDLVASRFRDPVVYYFGIGGGKAVSAEGYQPIDILSPLIASDFSLLIGSDISKGNFRAFVSLVKRELGQLPGIEMGDVSFSELTKDAEFQVDFMFMGKSRTIRIYYNVDSTKEGPSALNKSLRKGFQVLFSRGIPGIIPDMVRGKTMEKLLGNLSDGGLLFLEMPENFTLPGPGLRQEEHTVVSDFSIFKRIRLYSLEQPSRMWPLLILGKIFSTFRRAA
ncbi:MAG: hypothetical protein JW774_04900 [Candidatus Aureabacteria bacterium]|nr:hypothetical protein [Candidatus Auribacterota bacterium]